jgi:hypothetical protein
VDWKPPKSRSRFCVTPAYRSLSAWQCPHRRREKSVREFLGTMSSSYSADSWVHPVLLGLWHGAKQGRAWQPLLWWHFTGTQPHSCAPVLVTFFYSKSLCQKACVPPKGKCQPPGPFRNRQHCAVGMQCHALSLKCFQ